MSQFEPGIPLPHGVIPSPKVGGEADLASPGQDPDSFEGKISLLKTELAVLKEKLDEKDVVIASLENELRQKNEKIHDLEMEKLCDNKINFVLNTAGLELMFVYMQSVRKEADTLAFVFLDVNHFKQINSRISHTRADAVLAGYANHLTSLVRPGDAVARMGGDEFAIIANLDGIENPDDFIYRIAKPVNIPYFDGTGYSQYPISSSIGYTLIGTGERYDRVLQRADDAAVYIKTHHDRRGVGLKTSDDTITVLSLPEVHARSVD